MFVNPPVVNQQLGIRRSYLGETRRIASEFLKRNLQLIVFAQSRLSTEILTTYLKDDFEGVPGAPERIRGYRGGYLPHRRREIEKGLREGSVRAVVSTNALELGIDIGALDVVRDGRLSGHDRGHLAARRPRRPPDRPLGGGAGGRAARRSISSSCATRRTSSTRRPSARSIDPDNLHILVDHVKCAAFELPFTATRGVRPARRAGSARRAGRAGARAPWRASRRPIRSVRTARSAQWTWTNESYPADAVSLRSISSDNFVVVDTTRRARVIGETDFTSGPATLIRRRSTSSKGSCTRSSGSISRAARRSCAQSTATTTPTRSRTRA